MTKLPTYWTKTIRILVKSLAVVALSFVGLCSCIPEEQRESARAQLVSESRIIYGHETYNIADVFDLTTRTLEIRAKNELESPTEFGGPLNNCGDGTIDCLQVGLVFAIPKAAPLPTAWGGNGISCQRLGTGDASANSIAHIRCEYRGDYPTLFEYSTARGVTRYRRDCPNCPPGYMLLSSHRGLFARGA